MRTRTSSGTRWSPPRTASRHMRGISLIEVLVSVLVLGIGLLGVAAMQATALRGGQSSMETSQAIMQTTAIIEAMRTNHANVANYNTAGKRCSTVAAATLAENDLNNWVASLQATIGGGNTTCGNIAGCPGACVITVEWNDSRAGGAANRQVVTEARIL